MTVLVENTDGVALATIDRRDALNALNVETLTGLRDRLRELADDDAAELKKLGVAGVFGPGAPTTEIVDFLKGAVTA